MALTKQEQTREIKLLNSMIGSAPTIKSNLGTAQTFNDYQGMLRTISKSQAFMGEFIPTMTKKIAYEIFTISNFRSMLENFKTEEFEYGNAIEETIVGFIKAEAYKSQITPEEYLRTKIPDIRTAYHPVNRREQYETTIEDVYVKEQFEKGKTLGSLIAEILKKPMQSNARDEQNYMLDLIYDSHDKGEIVEVAVGRDEKWTDTFTEKAMGYNDLLQGEHTMNAVGIVNSESDVPRSMIIDPLKKAKLKVQTMANAFQINELAIDAKVVTLNKRWDDPNIVAFLLTDQWFRVANKMVRMTEMWNYKTLSTTFVLHVQQVISKSPFAGAVLFVHEYTPQGKVRLLVDNPYQSVGALFGDEVKVATYTQLADSYELPAGVTFKYTVKLVSGQGNFTASIDDAGVVTVKPAANLGGGEYCEVEITATPTNSDPEGGVDDLVEIKRSIWVTAGMEYSAKK